MLQFWTQELMEPIPISKARLQEGMTLQELILIPMTTDTGPVSGTVAAIYSNNTGVYGVAPSASLYAVKVLDSTGSGYLDWIIAGIDGAIAANEIDVINMSLGTTSDAIPRGCMQRSLCRRSSVVAAAGNSGNKPGNRDTVEYPGGYASVIAVAASDSNDARASF